MTDKIIQDFFILFFTTIVWPIVFHLKNVIFFKISNSLFSYIEAWFTDLEVGFNIKIKLVINKSVTYAKLNAI